MDCPCLTNGLSSTRTSEVVSLTHRTNDFLPFAGGLVVDALIWKKQSQIDPTISKFIEVLQAAIKPAEVAGKSGS
jgi:hypothetical protein